MSGFKVGDRVVNKQSPATTEIVVGVPGTPQYDHFKFGDANEGMLLQDDGWHYQRHWVLANNDVQVIYDRLRDEVIHSLDQK